MIFSFSGLVKHLKPSLSLKAIPIINRNCEGVPVWCLYTGHNTRDCHLYILTSGWVLARMPHTGRRPQSLLVLCTTSVRDAGGVQETPDSRSLISETRLRVKLCYHTHLNTKHLKIKLSSCSTWPSASSLCNYHILYSYCYHVHSIESLLANKHVCARIVFLRNLCLLIWYVVACEREVSGPC